MDIILWIIFLLVLGHITLTWWRAEKLGRRASMQSSSIAAQSDLPSVSVTVPAWREAAGLHLTFQALERVVYPTWEVIVIAGGPDGTYPRAVELAAAFQACPIQVLEQLPKGKNAALNQGFAQAKYDVIVILDGDTLVDPDWLLSLVGMLDERTAATCGNYFPLQRTWVSMLEQMEKISTFLVHGQIILQGSGSIAVKRDVLERIGGFPEDVRVGVDWDLDTRISNLHLPKAFVKTACVKTQRPSTLTQFWKNEIRWRRAHLSALWRQRATPQSVIAGGKFYVVAFVPLGALILIFGALVVGRSDVALFLVKLLCLFLLWVIGRRTAIIAEVAAYTWDTSWFSLLASPPILLMTSFVASWWAAATLSRQTMHFKGPRS